MQEVVPPIFQKKCKWLMVVLGLNHDDLLKGKSECVKFLYHSQNNHLQASLNNMFQSKEF